MLFLNVKLLKLRVHSSEITPPPLPPLPPLSFSSPPTLSHCRVMQHDEIYFISETCQNALYTEVNEIVWREQDLSSMRLHQPCQVTYGLSIERYQKIFLCFRVNVLGKTSKAPVTWNTALSECVSQMLHQICLQTVLPHLCIKLSEYFFGPDASLEEQCKGLIWDGLKTRGLRGAVSTLIFH